MAVNGPKNVANVTAERLQIRTRVYSSILTFVVYLTTVAPTKGQATFTPMGLFGLNRSRAHDVSADGTVVVGIADAQFFGQYELFRWTPQGSALVRAWAEATASISADGQVIVGATPAANGPDAIRVAPMGVAQVLGDLPGRTHTFGEDVSANGDVVVGFSGSVLGAEAFRWTQATGMVGLGGLPGRGNIRSLAYGTSADGSVVVGAASEPFAGYPFRWTAETGLVKLMLPATAIGGEARSVSANGSIIVGQIGIPASPGSQDIRREAFRWTAATGAIGLGDLAGGRIQSIAFDTSADGSVIVGRGETFFDEDRDPPVTEAAFYWTAESGMLNLQDLLVSLGATNLDGWQLVEAESVSADGLTIVGSGLHNGRTEGWVATIPEPSTIALAALSVASCVTLVLLCQYRHRQGNAASMDTAICVASALRRKGTKDERFRALGNRFVDPIVGAGKGGDREGDEFFGVRGAGSRRGAD
jgi:probable HAF family extracellular repeat protein